VGGWLREAPHGVKADFCHVSTARPAAATTTMWLRRGP